MEQKLEYVRTLLARDHKELMEIESDIPHLRKKAADASKQFHSRLLPRDRPGVVARFLNSERGKKWDELHEAHSSAYSNMFSTAKAAENATSRCGVLKNEVQRLEKVVKALEEKVAVKARAEERRQARSERAERKEKKRQEREAVAARALKEDRSLAASLRRQMERDHACPYCAEVLENDAQLDHIFPISYGGLSVRENLVFVCRTCNMKKKNMTLNEYIRRFVLNESQIRHRLTLLGKRY